MGNAQVDYSVESTPLEPVGGDIGWVTRHDDHLFIVLIDVVGHGVSAYQAAKKCRSYLEERSGQEPCKLLQGLHSFLKSLRAAVGWVGYLNLSTLNLCYACVGNIGMKLLPKRESMPSTQEGVMGYCCGTPHNAGLGLKPGDALILFSDGIRSHSEDYNRELTLLSAKEIAQHVMQTCSKGTDDSCCIALKVSA